MKVFWPVLSVPPVFHGGVFVCLTFECLTSELILVVRSVLWHSSDDIWRPHNKLLYEQQRSCVKWLGYWLISSVNSMVWHALPAKENGIMSSCKVRYWEPVILESRNLSSLHPRVTLSQRENIWLLQPSCNLFCYQTIEISTNLYGSLWFWGFFRQVLSELLALVSSWFIQ